MRLVEIVEHLDAARQRSLLALNEIASAAGTPSLSDHLRLDLESGGGPGFFAVCVSDLDGTIAFAQCSSANDGAVLEYVAHPGRDDRTIRDDTIETAIDVARRRGTRVTWWVDDPDDHTAALATRLGLNPARRLYEMRRSLPLDEHAQIETRAFEPGRDEQRWLDVNNRAFADHGEQGGWTLDTLRLRTSEPWFDPTGFRIHERNGTMAGFCWTKIHADHDPPIGEIYVIAVDPSAHGQGLGRQLTLAGLDAIAARGVEVADLYVDADNVAAMRLYEGLGFEIHRTRVAYDTDDQPAAGSDRPDPTNRT